MTNKFKNTYNKLLHIRAKYHEGRCTRITNILTGESNAWFNRHSGYKKAYDNYKNKSGRHWRNKAAARYVGFSAASDEEKACSHFINPVGRLRCRSLIQSRKEYDGWYGPGNCKKPEQVGGNKRTRRKNLYKFAGALSRRDRSLRLKKMYGGLSQCSDFFLLTGWVGGLIASLFFVDAAITADTIASFGTDVGSIVGMFYGNMLYHALVACFVFWLFTTKMKDQILHSKLPTDFYDGDFFWDGDSVSSVTTFHRDGENCKINNIDYYWSAFKQTWVTLPTDPQKPSNPLQFIKKIEGNDYVREKKGCIKSECEKEEINIIKTILTSSGMDFEYKLRNESTDSINTTLKYDGKVWSDNTYSFYVFSKPILYSDINTDKFKRGTIFKKELKDCDPNEEVNCVEECTVVNIEDIKQQNGSNIKQEKKMIYEKNSVRKNDPNAEAQDYLRECKLIQEAKTGILLGRFVNGYIFEDFSIFPVYISGGKTNRRRTRSRRSFTRHGRLQ